VSKPSWNRVSQYMPVNASIVTGWWFGTFCIFPFHIWDVIRNPLTNSIMFQDGDIAPPTRVIFNTTNKGPENERVQHMSPGDRIFWSHVELLNQCGFTMIYEPSAWEVLGNSCECRTRCCQQFGDINRNSGYISLILTGNRTNRTNRGRPQNDADGGEASLSHFFPAFCKKMRRKR